MWQRWRGLPDLTVSVPPCLPRLQLAAILCSNESGRLQEDQPDAFPAACPAGLLRRRLAVWLAGPSAVGPGGKPLGHVD